MTLRTDAGDSDIGRILEIWRDPTGSPVARYDSTIRLNISRDRRSSEINADRRGASLLAVGLGSFTAGIKRRSLPCFKAPLSRPLTCGYEARDGSDPHLYRASVEAWPGRP